MATKTDIFGNKINYRPQPGDINFVGPLLPPQPGESGFVGPLPRDFPTTGKTKTNITTQFGSGGQGGSSGGGSGVNYEEELRKEIERQRIAEETKQRILEAQRNIRDRNQRNLIEAKIRLEASRERERLGLQSTNVQTLEFARQVENRIKSGEYRLDESGRVVISRGRELQVSQETQNTISQGQQQISSINNLSFTQRFRNEVFPQGQGTAKTVLYGPFDTILFLGKEAGSLFTLPKEKQKVSYSDIQPYKTRGSISPSQSYSSLLSPMELDSLKSSKYESQKSAIYKTVTILPYFIPGIGEALLISGGSKNILEGKGLKEKAFGVVELGLASVGIKSRVNNLIVKRQEKLVEEANTLVTGTRYIKGKKGVDVLKARTLTQPSLFEEKILRIKPTLYSTNIRQPFKVVKNEIIYSKGSATTYKIIENKPIEFLSRATSGRAYLIKSGLRYSDNIISQRLKNFIGDVGQVKTIDIARGKIKKSLGFEITGKPYLRIDIRTKPLSSVKKVYRINDIYGNVGKDVYIKIPKAETSVFMGGGRLTKNKIIKTVGGSPSRVIKQSSLKLDLNGLKAESVYSLRAKPNEFGNIRLKVKSSKSKFDIFGGGETKTSLAKTFSQESGLSYASSIQKSGIAKLSKTPTKVNTIPLSPVIQKPTVQNNVKTVSITKTSKAQPMNIKSSTVQINRQRYNTAQTETTKQITSFSPVSVSVSKNASREMERLKNVSLQSQATAQRQVQRQKFKSLSVFSPITKKPIIPKKTKTPFLPIIPLSNKRILSSDNARGYTVSVRRRGVFRPVGRFSSYNQAYNKGLDVVGRTLASSFKVSGKGSKSTLGIYRSKKEPGVYIEQRKYRLSKPTEKREINMFKSLRSSKKKRKSLF